MRRLFPAADPDEEVDLEQAYAWPDEPCLRVNFVSSLDGAAALAGRSGGLGGSADRAVFSHLRATCDVILVGARTASAERYRPARAPVAVVSAALSLSPDERLFTSIPGRARPLVLTCAAAPTGRRAALSRHAEVVDCGGEALDLALVLAVLHARGLRRVLCEGGPRLFATLVTAGLVDELCLTLAPLLAPGDAPRITSGPPVPSSVGATLLMALEEDSSLLLRYRLS